MTERYDLELCTSSHASAEKEQTQVRELMQKMSKQDYMVHVEGGMSCAQQRFPTGELAIGKLGVASALGKEDRMIRDSSRGGASPSARFSERAEVPSLFLFTAALCRLAAWSGVPVNCKDRVLLSVDIKGATNQSALQQRTLVFSVLSLDGRLPLGENFTNMLSTTSGQRGQCTGGAVRLRC